MLTKFIRRAFVLTICALVCSPVIAQEEPTTNKAAQEKQLKELKDALGSLKIDLQTIKPDTVVARVGGKTFTADEVAAAMQTTLRTAAQAMGPEAAKALTPEVLFLIAREQVVDMYLLEKEVKANAERLKKDPEVQEAIQAAVERTLQEAYVKENVEQYVTKKRIHDKYQEFQKEFPKDAEEVRIRMIVVKTEDEAKGIIDQLNNKADFLKLAREKSIDKKSAENDGDMGYINEVAKGTLLPGFDVIFEKKNSKPTMPTGSFTKTAIKSPMGYHILKIEDRRPLKKPKLAELEPVLKELLRQEAAQKMQEKIKQKAGNIERLHPNTGKPMKSLEEELKAIQSKISGTLADMKTEEKPKPKQ